jgi:hypothetical protein
MYDDAGLTYQGDKPAPPLPPPPDDSSILGVERSDDLPEIVAGRGVTQDEVDSVRGKRDIDQVHEKFQAIAPAEDTDAISDTMTPAEIVTDVLQKPVFKKPKKNIVVKAVEQQKLKKNLLSFDEDD